MLFPVSRLGVVRTLKATMEHSIEGLQEVSRQLCLFPQLRDASYFGVFLGNCEIYLHQTNICKMFEIVELFFFVFI